ncbi:MAG: hypothetical protein ABWX62_05425, partial [Microterricola sp.]
PLFGAERGVALDTSHVELDGIIGVRTGLGGRAAASDDDSEGGSETSGDGEPTTGDAARPA